MERTQRQKQIKAMRKFEKPGDASFRSFIEENLDEEDGDDRALKERILSFFGRNLEGLKRLHLYLVNEYAPDHDNIQSSGYQVDRLARVLIQAQSEVDSYITSTPSVDHADQTPLYDVFIESLLEEVLEETVSGERDNALTAFEAGYKDVGRCKEIKCIDEAFYALEIDEREEGAELDFDEGLREEVMRDLEQVEDPFKVEHAFDGEASELSEELVRKQLEVFRLQNEQFSEMRAKESSIQIKDYQANFRKIELLVNQAQDKERQIAQRIKDEEKLQRLHQLQKAQLEISRQQQEQAAGESKGPNPQDEADDLAQMIGKTPAQPQLAPVRGEGVAKRQALPTSSIYANLTRMEQLQALKDQDPQDAREESMSSSMSQMDDSEYQVGGPEQPEVFAVEDTEPLEDFDVVLPEANRAMTFPFELDVFQKRAILRLEQGDCVFIAAHTSAGKTVVAEYAIALSFKNMTKTIFTAPIKALSNQKFKDFKHKFEDVGITTGDVTINRDATCVIMTTEILRDITYKDVEFLKDVEWVIFDEVHYVNDAERGSVWEEVIVKLPDHIGIVMLSATFSNYFEFADWVGRTKNKRVYVQQTLKRPVPLEHHFIHQQNLSLVKLGEAPLNQQAVSTALAKYQQHRRAEMQQKNNKGGNPGKNIDIKAKQELAKKAGIDKQIAKGMGKEGGQGPNSQRKGASKYEHFFKNMKKVKAMNLLPCIVFFFSRAAVEELAFEADVEMDFIGDRERKEIKQFKKKALGRLEGTDRELPQVKKLEKLLEKGIGFHHAGMIPLLKEVVEILFTEGLLKVVFATSTFAIGLNMPARSVIFTQTMKFNKEARGQVPLDSMEYLQMAGRAGRRGQDDKGISLICLDHNFGFVPKLPDFEKMFSVDSKDVASQLKVTYKTNLNNCEGHDINALISSSFYQNASEQKKIQAMRGQQRLGARLRILQGLDCQCDSPDGIRRFFADFKQLQELNVSIQEGTKLKPIVFHICEVFTAELLLAKVIVLNHNQSQTLITGEVSQEYFTCLVLENRDDGHPLIPFEENKAFEEQLQMYVRRMKSRPLVSGYRHQIVQVRRGCFVRFFKNRVGGNGELQLLRMSKTGAFTLNQKDLRQMAE
mmetsp:Transcript_13364/g.22730  ORF Transcript_13364/g.22730 Transcript_13364/m.22730 type:complete len:1110 (+) Transcript_13364:480-3809(+)